MTRQHLAITLVAILFAIAFGVWFNATYEYRDVDEYVGFRGEARSNHLFAARLFLRRMGIPAERKDSLDELPPTDGVLLLDTQRYTLSAQKLEEILAWVNNGGHLITRARTTGDETLYGDSNDDVAQHDDRDPLQQALGIRLGEHVLTDEDTTPLAAQLPNMNRPLTVDPEFFDALEVAGDAYLLNYQGAAWLLEKPLGNGLVTFASHLGFIDNVALDNHDHAAFFWYMVHSRHQRPTAVWLVHQDDMPPLWQLIWQHAWALVLTLVMFIPLVILAYSPRFGPLIPPPEPSRRRIIEHIHASSLFMWRRYRKQNDTAYREFAATAEQLYPSMKTDTRHDNSKPDA